MDFIDQEAECSSDCSDSSSLNDNWAEDMESFIDDEEYESDDGVHTFANVVKPIDEEDPQPRLYDRNSVDGREIDNFKEDKYRAEEFRNSLLSFETGEESNLFFFGGYIWYSLFEFQWACLRFVNCRKFY